MERAGLVIARPYQRRPLRLEYQLTQEGDDLGGVVLQLAAWGDARTGSVRPRHGTCGTELEVRLWCPTCEQAADRDSEAGEADDLVWL
jgi:hypothetical protein